ncbi:MAG: FAD-dependent oxidoreductase [Acidobacteriota bacterium]|jgi:succinate dehydrogenase/fumarate reductase flavoprotein subunit|nr:FAD-dependent oxidoreductase [Acidobacteriota bacterium]
MKGDEKKVSRRRFLKKAAVAAPAAAAVNAWGAPQKSIPPPRWDKEADVVIIGTGFAGLSAAIAAKDAGAKVLVLEKLSQQYEGGNSRVSGNMWWTPTNLPEAIEYIDALCAGLTDKESIQALAEEMMQLNGWLETLGIKPQPLGIFQPEHPELPGAKCVRTWSNGGAGEGKLWIPIREQVEKRGIPILYETPAKDLVLSANREVLGVLATSGGKQIAIKASKGVVLACGGFEFDFEMQKQYLPGWPTYGRGTPGNTGDGIRMAQKAGAALWHMNNSLAGIGCLMVPEFEPVMIPVSFPGNAYVLVDKTGKRFMNEMRENRHGFGHKENLLYFDGVLGAFTRLPCFGIFDESARMRGSVAGGTGFKFGWFGWFGGYQGSRDNSKEIEKGWIIKGDTLAELAGKLGMKPADLEATIARWNESCKNKTDQDFGRPARSLTSIEKPPFYCVKVYPATFNTQGGPRRNAKCQVVDPYHQPIPGLCSAGELGSFWGWMYNGGGNNSEALCTGRMAVRTLLKK